MRTLIRVAAYAVAVELFGGVCDHCGVQTLDPTPNDGLSLCPQCYAVRMSAAERESVGRLRLERGSRMIEIAQLKGQLKRARAGSRSLARQAQRHDAALRTTGGES